ncbi:glycosyltransferase family 4 protein [Endozoicomonas sp. SCSIO W0465]|uniref:glycosyltransferase family 4 protein n=1 Tax=Endozoicomonas sp. SCSIO W0465 TaxID=2918516 RepID=UPI00207549F1|nr:glycosyltransferase family 4 protein [Endozoicomonas sp. SCSIO W0465]USE35168.1 glycosyltransferase family 4 protein [Endozoicomonas sp. SCSIO W0465]
MADHPIIILLDSRQAGGIETHVYQLAKALQSSGWLAEIWFYQKYQAEHPLEQTLKDSAIRFRYLNGRLVQLISELKSTQPLILHTHGYKAGIFGRLAAVITRTPVASTFHNGDPGEGMVRLYSLLDQLSSPISENIAVSDEIARRWIRAPRRIDNFVDVPEHYPSSGKAISFVGRLSHEKGPDLFLQLAKHQPLLPFRLYGSGPMEEILQKQQVHNVMFMGQVKSMEAHWREIGLLCITSRFEGLPMVALEAMAHGVPVLSFPLGGLPDLILQGFNGWTSPVGDLNEMSNLLQFWFSLPEAVKWQIREACVATIINRYSSQAILPKILDVYQQAVQAKGHDWPKTLKTASAHSLTNKKQDRSQTVG